jgi:hypothetical protein
MSANSPTWRRVQSDDDRETSRLEVPGGWLYMVIEKGEMGGIMKEFMCFVPKPPPKADEGPA